MVNNCAKAHLLGHKCKEVKEGGPNGPPRVVQGQKSPGRIGLVPCNRIDFEAYVPARVMQGVILMFCEKITPRRA